MKGMSSLSRNFMFSVELRDGFFVNAFRFQAHLASWMTDAWRRVVCDFLCQRSPDEVCDVVVCTSSLVAKMYGNPWENVYFQMCARSALLVALLTLPC